MHKTMCETKALLSASSSSSAARILSSFLGLLCVSEALRARFMKLGTCIQLVEES